MPRIMAIGGLGAGAADAPPPDATCRRWAPMGPGGTWECADMIITPWYSQLDWMRVVLAGALLGTVLVGGWYLFGAQKKSRRRRR